MTATVESQQIDDNSQQIGDEDMIMQDSSVSIIGHNTMSVCVHGCRPTKHPVIALRMKPTFRKKFVDVKAIADTGAQTNLWSLDKYLQAGYTREELRKVSVKLAAANRQPIDIVGAFDAEFQGESPTGETISCQSTVYVSRTVSEFFLSFSTLINLLVIDKNFPMVGNYRAESRSDVSPMAAVNDHYRAVPFSIRAVNLGCLEGNDQDRPCDCPQRSAVPGKPKTLPFAPVPENIPRMKE